MKKIVLCLLLVGLCLFAGCSNAPSANTQETTNAALTPVTCASEWVDVLAATVPFEDQMTVVDGSTAMMRYGVDEAYSGDCAMYISSMATPEEIAVFKAADGFDTQYFTDLAAEYLAVQKDSYADYAPDQVPKLDTAVVRTCGEYVIVCVSADNEKAASVVDAYIGK